MKDLFGIGRNDSVRYYRQYYRLISVAVLITVAVIVGSLLIGNSVRQTLIHRVEERLGKVESVIFSRNSFLSDSIMQEPLFAQKAKGALLSDGFISRNGQLLPVMVWGIEDENMFGRAYINQSLADELRLSSAEDIVLRLPKGGLVPSGSLFVTDNYTASLRLEQAGIKSTEEGGNLSLKNEQTLPLNIFVCREELAEVMEVEGKINLILSEAPISEDDLSRTWNPSFSGFQIMRTADYTEISTDRVFLQSSVVDYIGSNNELVNPLFTYLANGIRLGNTSVPYSFVTAIKEFDGHTLQSDEVILSDYTAQRLHASVGDSIIVSYYVSKGLKDLKTDSVCLHVGDIVPLSRMVEDGRLSAEFPGLSDVERCTDWDSDLPLDMTLITDEDEEYWNMYRSTPKALLPYSLMKDIWSNDYGTATALRVYDETAKVDGLQLSMFDVQIIQPRESGLYAAKNGIDFASLFLALGFFIIVSALLLFVSPLSEMLWQRRGEIQLFKALGYTGKHIIRNLWKEALPIVCIASIFGVIAGILYTVIVMWLLGNIWQGATQTSSLGVYIDVVSVLIGVAVCIIVIVGLLWYQIAKAVHKDGKSEQTEHHKGKRIWVSALGFSILSLVVFIVNILSVNSLYLFVLLGVLLVVLAGLWGEYFITRKSRPESDSFNQEKQTYATLFYQMKQLRGSYYALAFGVFTIFAVGLNRQQVSDSQKPTNATGGYTLWTETSVPVYYDLSTTEGRHQMALDALPSGTSIMQTLRLGADDASCLNLNKVSQPTILGVDMAELQGSTFEIASGDNSFFDYSQKKGNAYPVIVDQESLMWSLGMAVGDTLHYQKDNGDPVHLVIAGALSTGIFQGYALMDKHLFKEVWPEISGSEIMLIKTSQSQEVSALLSQALNEYGIRVMTTAQRLNTFNELVNTYLSIFLSLGGIGMLLGILSFIIVIRKNLLVRQTDIRLYKSIGYAPQRIEELLFRENVLLPLYAVCSGTIAALLSTCNNFSHNDWMTWLQCVALTILFIGLIWWFVKRNCSKAVRESSISKSRMT